MTEKGAVRIFIGGEDLKCSVCDYRGSSKRDILQHSETHNEDYECSKCDFKCASESQMYHHMLKHMLRNSSIISNISKQSRNIEELVVDINSTDNPGINDSAKSRSSRNYVPSYAEDYSDSENDYEINTKDKSNIIQSTETELNNDEKNKIFNKGNYIECSFNDCDLLLYVEHVQKHLQDHKLGFVKNSNQEKKIKRFMCTECGKKFMCFDSISKHIANHFIEKPPEERVCTECGYKSKRLSSFKSHHCNNAIVDDENISEALQYEDELVTKNKYICKKAKKVTNDQEYNPSENSDNFDDSDDSHDFDYQLTQDDKKGRDSDSRSKKKNNNKMENKKDGVKKRKNTQEAYGDDKEGIVSKRKQIKNIKKEGNVGKRKSKKKLCTKDKEDCGIIRKKSNGVYDDRLAILKVACTTCNEIFDNKALYKIHFRNVQTHCKEKEKMWKEAVNEELGKFYLCLKCNKTSLKKDLITDHVARSHSKIKYYCDQCEYASCRLLLVRHLKSVHENETSICSLCGKTFTNKVRLREHIKRVHSNRTTLCNICGESFKKISEHMMIHTGEKPFACELCHFSTIKKWNLDVHMRSHENEGSVVHTRTKKNKKYVRSRVNANDWVSIFKSMEYYDLKRCDEDFEGSVIMSDSNCFFEYDMLQHNEVQEYTEDSFCDNGSIISNSSSEQEYRNELVKNIKSSKKSKNNNPVNFKPLIKENLSSDEDYFNTEDCYGSTNKEKADLIQIKEEQLYKEVKEKIFSKDNYVECLFKDCDLIVYIDHLQKHLQDHKLGFVEQNSNVKKKNKTYMCTECGQKYLCFDNLSTHVFNHIMEKPPEERVCNVCGYKSKRLSSFKIHNCNNIIIDNDNTSEASQPTVKSVANKKYLTKNIKKETNDQEYNPSENIGISDNSDGSNDSQSDDSDYQLPRVKKEGSGGKSKRKNKAFIKEKKNCGSTRDKIKNPNTERIDNLKVACTRCNKDFDNKALYNDHLKNRKTPCNKNEKLFKEELGEEFGKKIYLCLKCDKTSLKKDNIEDHVARYHSKIKYYCDQCEFVSSRRFLTKHFRSVHENETSICSICGKIYKNRERLQEHIKRVHSRKPTLCNICGQVFKKMSEHMKIHTGVKPFPCKLCSFSTIKKWNLDVHMRSHEREGYVGYNRTPKDKRNEKSKDNSNDFISHLATSKAQLDHRENLGSHKADSVGYAYPQNFAQLIDWQY